MNTLTFDEIHIEELEVFANHGVFPEENRLGQKFLISLTMYVDSRIAGKTDCLESSADYGDICRFMTEFTKANPRRLIETAAEDLAEAILIRYNILKGVTLELKKPWAPVGLPLKTVSVKITRFRHTACIGLGSNLGDKKAYLDNAVKALDETKGCHVKKVSSYYVTEPYGGVEQDDFLNACLILETLFTPEELLKRLHEIEQAAHRERLVHWGPRTLDLDILLYDDAVIETDDLIIPHSEMHLRSFVLQPLCEIAPNKRHPVLKKTVSQLADLLKKESERSLTE